ncbi:MAG: alpha-amylase family glycosyl hydrolase [Paludibacter sp.]|nr:alpha-amylase family glycosyl hydrolase [Paludibacter sp.]
MKKSTLTILTLLISLLSWAQIVTTNPTFVTKDYSGVIEVTYDATQGTAGLKDYTGTVYAHTGVITSESKSTSDWKHAPTWGDNSAKYQLTSLGDNKWKLLITPDMTSYYGLNTGEVVQKLAFVFRSGEKVDGSYLEGKDVGGTDIFAEIYDAGLNVTFTAPTSNQSTTVGSTLDFTVTASLAADLELKVNGTLVKTETSATTLTYSKTFSATGDYTFIASASLDGGTVYDTLQVCVPEAVTTETRPTGVVDGINYIDNSTVTLVLLAPGKSNVFVIGDFNDWSQLNAYQMKKDGNYWWITLTDLTPGKMYGFQYLVDGSLRVSDPYTELVLDPWNDKWINEYYDIYPELKAYPEGKTDGLVGTLQTNKPAYNWEISNFSTPDRDNMIIYELLLRDFTVEKSLEAAITKLDYLKTLGITAIELMPVQEFDGNNSWGYNPNHYFAPDKAYGSPEMYKKFIDECHKRGIAVILDIVLNHATGICPFAELYWDDVNDCPASDNPWMNVSAPHPYGVYNDFNHTSTYTREYFKRMVKYWITEYKVDGYRLDLTKGLTQTQSSESTASNYDQSRIDNISAYYDAAKSVKSDVMFILEHFCNNDEETALANKGMYLWRNINDAFSQAAMGYQSSSDFSGLVASPRHWVGYAESHDQERNFYKAKMYGDGTIKTDSLVRIARVPLNIAFTTLVPGPKMMYEFEELGYDYSIDSQGGRTSSKPSAWGWLNLTHRQDAYDKCSKIITLRKMYQTAFSEGTFSAQMGSSDWSNGRRISLTHNDLNMVVLGNFQSSASVVAYPSFSKTGTWYNLFTGESMNVSDVNMTMTLEPGELLIYTDRQISFADGIDDPVSAQNCLIYPTITSESVFISTDAKVESVSVYNIEGVLVKYISESKEVDLSSFNNGIYLVKVSTSKGDYISKILKN